MSEQPIVHNSIDEHIGKRLQLRRTMMGLSQRDLANLCGVTSQQIQKYERAENRIYASRLFELSSVLETPITFFFRGLPGLMPEPDRTGRIQHVAQQTSKDDPLSKNESLTLINLYWKLPGDDKREMVMKLLRSLNGME